MEKVKYLPNNEDDFMADRLLPCPFCGGEAGLIFIGNNVTKKKSVEIGCTGKCRCRIINSTVYNRHSAEHVANLSISQWNGRVAANKEV